MKRYKATASTVHFYLDENGPWCDVRDVDARIAELTADVERLRKLVPDAYREGFGDGFYEDSASDDPMTVGKGWETSFSKIDLDALARNALREGE
jgi:hypothetical protein